MRIPSRALRNDASVIEFSRPVFDQVMRSPDLSERQKLSLLGAVLQAWTGMRPTGSSATVAKYRDQLTTLGLEELLQLEGFRLWARRQPGLTSLARVEVRQDEVRRRWGLVSGA